jgi:hypothetical protein
MKDRIAVFAFTFAIVWGTAPAVSQTQVPEACQRPNTTVLRFDLFDDKGVTTHEGVSIHMQRFKDKTKCQEWCLLGGATLSHDGALHRGVATGEIIGPFIWLRIVWEGGQNESTYRGILSKGGGRGTMYTNLIQNSANWSMRTIEGCERWPELPPKPQVPQHVKVQCLPPNRAVVTWEAGIGTVDYMITINGKDYTVPNDMREYKQTIEIPADQVADCTSVTICARDFSGQTCVLELGGPPPRPDVSELAKPKEIISDNRLPPSALRQGGIISRGDPIPSIDSVSRQGGIIPRGDSPSIDSVSRQGSIIPRGDPIPGPGVLQQLIPPSGGSDGIQRGTSVPGVGGGQARAPSGNTGGSGKGPQPKAPSGGAVSCPPGGFLINGQCNSGGSDTIKGPQPKTPSGSTAAGSAATGGGISTSKSINTPPKSINSPSNSINTPAKSASVGAVTSTTATGDRNSRFFRNRSPSANSGGLSVNKQLAPNQGVLKRAGSGAAGQSTNPGYRRGDPK